MCIFVIIINGKAGLAAKNMDTRLVYVKLSAMAQAMQAGYVTDFETAIIKNEVALLPAAGQLSTSSSIQAAFLSPEASCSLKTPYSLDDCINFSYDHSLARKVLNRLEDSIMLYAQS